MDIMFIVFSGLLATRRHHSTLPCPGLWPCATLSPRPCSRAQPGSHRRPCTCVQARRTAWPANRCRRPSGRVRTWLCHRRRRPQPSRRAADQPRPSPSLSSVSSSIKFSWLPCHVREQEEGKEEDDANYRIATGSFNLRRFFVLNPFQFVPVALVSCRRDLRSRVISFYITCL